MNKSRRTLCRHVGLALCLLMIFTVLPVPVAASETKTDTESKTVRVGWYPDSYHITGENGERSGYGYEYEQAVAAYTGWNYEYIKGDWGELVEKLQNGEIDLMAALSYTDERAETMLFSDLPHGKRKILSVCRSYKYGYFSVRSFYPEWQKDRGNGRERTGNSVSRMGRKAEYKDTAFGCGQL